MFGAGAATTSISVKAFAAIFPPDARGAYHDETVEQYVALRLSEKAAHATINRELALLRRAVVLARLTKRPVIRSLPENNVRRGFLGWADFRRIREKLPNEFRDIATFLYLSGRPQGHVAALEWRDIDMERCEMARDDKSEGVHKIALSGELRAVLQQAHATRLQNCPFVFHRDGAPFHLRGSKSPLRKAWARACADAGFGGHLLNDLRRSGVRNMIGAGVDPMTAMKLSGFKTIAMLAEIDQGL